MRLTTDLHAGQVVEGGGYNEYVSSWDGQVDTTRTRVGVGLGLRREGDEGGIFGVRARWLRDLGGQARRFGGGTSRERLEGSHLLAVTPYIGVWTVESGVEVGVNAVGGIEEPIPWLKIMGGRMGIDWWEFTLGPEDPLWMLDILGLRRRIRSGDLELAAGVNLHGHLQPDRQATEQPELVGGDLGGTFELGFRAQPVLFTMSGLIARSWGLALGMGFDFD